MAQVALSSELENKLRHVLAEHLNAIDNALQSSREAWTKYIRLYKAVLTSPKKDFPFPNCSNVFIPEIFNVVSTATAHILGTTVRNDPPFRVISEYGTEEDVKLAEDIEHFLRYYTTSVQNQPNYWRAHLPYLILLGTHVCKLQSIDSQRGHPVVRIDPVNLHRMYAYPGIPRWREAPFLADQSWISTGTIAKWVEEGVTTKERAQRVISHEEALIAKTAAFGTYRIPDLSIPAGYVPIYDIYFRWNHGNMLEVPKYYRILYYRDTYDILLIDDWTGRQPPYEFVYWRRDEDNVFGIGLGDVLWTLQEAMNTAFNQGVDNATVANVRMLAAPPGCGIEPGEPIYPGKVFIGANADKIRELRVGDVHPSAWAVPATVRQTISLTSGFNDTFLGMSDTVQKTRFTFSGAALNVQQGTLRLDLNSAEFEEGLTEIVWHTLEALSTYHSGEEIALPSKRKAGRQATILKELIENAYDAPDLSSTIRAVLTEEEATMFEEVVFRIPSTVMKRERFRIRPSRRDANAQVERQAAIILAQLVQTYLKQVVELTNLMGDPNLLRSTIEQVWKVANAAMRKVLVAFTVEESSELIIDFAEVQNALAAILPVQPSNPVPGQAGGGEQPSMDEFVGAEGAMGIEGTAGGILGGTSMD